MKLDKDERAFDLKRFMSDPLYKQGDPEMNRQFEKAFVNWWAATLRAAKGARLKRLKSGLTFASMYFLRFTWFPAFGSLKGLIPEFEVKDYKDGFRYIDFAFLTNAYRVAIEVDGRTSHRLNATPSEYEDELMRQNHLIIDGWSVIRLAFLSIRDKPRQCQQVLQQMLGKLRIDTYERLELTITERRILEYAARSSGPLEPFELRNELGLHRNTISRYIASLVSKGLIVPVCEDHKHKYRYLLSTKAE
ncbi:helix-turn-helix domain-containing protein [Cohnella rhizosphaerae]|uniref:MarR family transcriptional regulator n=1 Tax=Cohnella rhizosphaerae TaxID=1457232 RepID=A0A9X4QUQ5_9BACL|nr:helix-turn-helix domain-containing protein [Cohnella rhizosphaerae]MDG0811754.1 MarR family transcriptional regulator [Cohnella rhizosphaerae]